MSQLYATLDCDTDLVGKATNELRIVRCLALGRMSDVYLASSTHYDEPIVLKFERSDACDQRRSRFDREISLHSKIKTASVPRFLRAGHAFGRRFIAMQYIPGRDLSLYTQPASSKSGPLGATHVIDLFIGAFSALEELSNDGIIHRDIKPANILVALDGHVWLCDLGVATYRRPEPFTQDEHVLGTPGYLSPEQWAGEVLDVRSDIYAMGITMLETMTGLGCVLRQDHRVAVHPDFVVPDTLFTALCESYPRELVDVVRTCLRANRRHRYQHPSRVVDALQRARHAIGDAGTRAETMAAPPEPQGWRWSDVVIAALFILMVLVYLVT